MTDPLIAAARFLQSQLEWLRHAVNEQGEPYAVVAFAEIDWCAGRLRGLVNGPSEKRYLGPCGALVGAEADTRQGQVYSVEIHCDGDMYVRGDASVGRCGTCGATVSRADREAWLDGEVRAYAFTAAQIAEAYAINVKTIRSWATDRPESRDHHGALTRSATPARLRTHATSRDGQPLFLVGDVLDLAADDAARRAENQAKRARQTESAA